MVDEPGCEELIVAALTAGAAAGAGLGAKEAIYRHDR